MKRIMLVFLASMLLAVGADAAFKKVNTYNGSFVDVPDTAWYAENVKTAYELGFMQGKTPTVFDPNGNVTVAEGLAIASRLHAQYNNTVVAPRDASAYEHRIDFDDPSYLVDLTKRNARNNNGVNFYRSFGELRDGMIVFRPDKPNANGSYDPGLTIEGLNLDSRLYNKIKFRMKIEPLPGVQPDKKRADTTQVFFKTSLAPSIDEAKSVKIPLDKVENISQWFEIEFDMFKNSRWQDFIKGLRFDPSGFNGIYYLDYIVFSKSENSPQPKWYEMYYDYAVDNGIIDLHKYSISDVSRYITRAELCELFLSAFPNEYYNAINDIKGIPDIDRNDKNADAYLMLYNAGIVFGSDSEGNFNPSSFVKRSETATIINRVAIPENRVKGSVAENWSEKASKHNIEFDDKTILNSMTYEAKSFDITDGAAVLESLQRPNGMYDPKISLTGLNINASDYPKIRIRMKIEDVPDETPTHKCQFFFMTEGDTGYTEGKSVSNEFLMVDTSDAAGWYIIDLDMRLTPLWKGNVKAIRFDPSSKAGTYYIDYIRFVEDDYYKLKTHDDLINAGYTATRLLQDEHFERGFYVSKWDHTEGYQHGIWQDYCETDQKPLWQIGPWWTKNDLIDDRDTTTDKYTLSDKKGASTITYNPEEKSIIMRVDATKVYEGKPYVYEEDGWWTHLLLEQNSAFAPFDKIRNSAAADRMIAEIDVRCLDFKDTINPEGENRPSFLIYYYLMTDKAPGQRIWFGLGVFSGLNANNAGGAGWSPDSAAHQYMYGLPQAVLFDGLENSFNPEPGKVVVGKEWKKIRLDVTPHIQRAVEWANRDNIFGVPVTVEDMYFSGVNIGFETWGNFDYTFEFKNFNMVSYNK